MNQQFIKSIVSVAGYESTSSRRYRRRIKTPVRLYISKVSYDDRPGTTYLLRKWWYTKNKADAQQFSKIMAEDIQKFLFSQRLTDVQTEQVKVTEEVSQ